MIYGVIKSEKVLPKPGLKALCPECLNEVRPKRGEINVWHWAHVVKECSYAWKLETAWHVGWKSKFKPEFCEIKIFNHRADVRLPNGVVIEFQNSSISPEEIRDREACYKNLIWVINAEEFAKNFNFKEKEGYWTFSWAWARKTFQHFTKRVFIDFCGGLFEIRKLYKRGGWGQMYSYSEFLGMFPANTRAKESLQNNSII